MVEENSISITQLYNEILRNRSEIKDYIEASESTILLKIENLTHRVHTLEKENLELQNKCEQLERLNKKNNLMIFGLKKPGNTLTATDFIVELNSLLNTNIVETDISDLYTLGRNENSPIKLELVSYLKKREILKKCSKLKGTNIRIAHDLTSEQRKDNNILRKHLAIAKQTNEKCFIRNNNLHVNGEVFTVEQLIEQEIQEDNAIENRPASAPATPYGQNQTNNISSFNEENTTETIPTTPRTQTTCMLPNEPKITESKIIATDSRPSSSRVTKTRDNMILRSNSTNK